MKATNQLKHLRQEMRNALIKRVQWGLRIQDWAAKLLDQLAPFKVGDLLERVPGVPNQDLDKTLAWMPGESRVLAQIQFGDVEDDSLSPNPIFRVWLDPPHTFGNHPISLTLRQFKRSFRKAVPLGNKICGMVNCKHMILRRTIKEHDLQLYCARFSAWLNTKKNPRRKLAVDEATDLAVRCDACERDDGYEPGAKEP